MVSAVRRPPSVVNGASIGNLSSLIARMLQATASTSKSSRRHPLKRPIVCQGKLTRIDSADEYCVSKPPETGIKLESNGHSLKSVAFKLRLTVAPVTLYRQTFWGCSLARAFSLLVVVFFFFFFNYISQYFKFRLIGSSQLPLQPFPPPAPFPLPSLSPSQTPHRSIHLT